MNATPLSLEEAIMQLVTLGEKDPLTIVEKLLRHHGEDWLHEQASFLASDLAADMARRLLSAGRRHSELALRTGDPVTSAELKVRSYWVPDEGWMPAHKLTPTHLRSRAVFYERLSQGAVRRAMWCREVAELMESEGVLTLGKLRVPLPALPDDEALLLEAVA